ncbi:multidrug effflux MFS transporter [Pseudomonas sp. dw_358]|uniref:multidrug effflux MFS transporter n=1 Tax=Pseudomonas sp. dw_358 TaxID=2720083 RepID=UPI001BD2F75F|nr:multidrug effflux MFS transporter [Pseudomonas sp. dw_358]
MPAPTTIKAPVWLLVMVTISGTLAMHMFVPALPDAAASLGVSRAAMQLTITVYILGLAFGQLLYGPLSDGLGRRPMLLFGLSLYTLGGLAALLAPDVHTLIIARLFQALGGCAGLALGRAMVRDTSQADDAVRDLALLNLMMMVGPGLAPLFGSLVAASFGWRAIFLVLTALGVTTLLCSWRLLPETSHPSGKISLLALKRDYATLLRSPTFLGFAAGGGLATTSIYAFIAAAPFIIAGELHRPAHEVGLYLGLLIVGMSVGNALTRRLVRTVKMDRLLLCGCLISTVSATALLALVLSGHLNLPGMLGLMFTFTLGAGLCSPAALTRALGVDAGLVGSAAGLYGFAQMAAGALCTLLVGRFADPALGASAVLCGATLIGSASFLMALRYDRPAEAVSVADAT